MTEEQAYDKLQDLMATAVELHQSGHYSLEEILAEVRNAIVD